MTVTEESEGKRAVKSSVEIMARESAEANILKFGRMLRCVKRSASAGAFVSSASSRLPGRSAHTAQEKCTHIVGKHHNMSYKT